MVRDYLRLPLQAGLHHNTDLGELPDLHGDPAETSLARPALAAVHNHLVLQGFNALALGHWPRPAPDRQLLAAPAPALPLVVAAPRKIPTSPVPLPADCPLLFRLLS